MVSRRDIVAELEDAEDDEQGSDEVDEPGCYKRASTASCRGFSGDGYVTVFVVRIQAGILMSRRHGQS